MSIKVSGTVVIDDTKAVINAASIAFNNGSSVNTVYSSIDARLVDTGNTQPLFTLDDPNPFSTPSIDNFGQSVAISGNYAIVGAPFEDSGTATNAGKAYIYDVTTGTLLWTLDNPNAYGGVSPDDRFGNPVAISSKYVIVGVPTEDDAGGTSSGKAYIYDVNTGALLWTLDNPNAYSTSGSDLFGYSVAISDDYAIVGAYGEDDTGTNDSGIAYIYNASTGALLWTLNDPTAYSSSAGDRFGHSVGISGNYAIVAAYSEADDSGVDSGKAYIFNVTTGTLVYTLDNPNAYNTSAYDNFGTSVAISGNYAIVAAIGEDDPTNGAAGAAYIFNVTTGTLLWKLNNPNAYGTSLSDQFGYSVAISGNYAIVGAYQEDDAGGTSSGKAYIFNVTTGALVYTLDDPNAYGTSVGDYFGISVAISGNYAIVGAYGEDVTGYSAAGKAYIFKIGSTYSLDNIGRINFSTGSNIDLGHKAFQIARYGGEIDRTFNDPNPYSTSQADNFGYSVAISGNYAVVGAYNEDVVTSPGLGAGKAYIFNVVTGTLLRTLDNPNAYSSPAGDYFGQSVAISGNTVVVGAWQEDDAGGTESGKAYIYNAANGALLWTLNNPNTSGASAYDYFGSAVAVSGKYAIITAPSETNLYGAYTGKAYVYNASTGTLLYTLEDPDTDGNPNYDNFGTSAAMHGTRAIVGAYYEDDASGTNSGRAYIFDITTGTLLQMLSNPNPYGTSDNDYFGTSVGISGDYAIVGAPNEDEASGDNSGKAYVFDVNSGTLLWTFNNPNPYDTPTNDFFGTSVAIDGKYAIVGAPYENEATGTDSGKVYIYDVTTGELVYTVSNPNAYNTTDGDLFGHAVAISGNYALAGAWGEDDAGGVASGKAYLIATHDITYIDKLATMAESL